MKKENKRYYWIDIIKIIACILVIINHSAGYILEYAGRTTATITVYSIIFAICKMGVPLFIMSTGFLILVICIFSSCTIVTFTLRRVPIIKKIFVSDYYQKTLM